MNLIENAKKGAVERSAENYLRAVETAVAAERMNNSVEDGTYTVDLNGNITLNDKTIKVQVSGSKPTPESKIVIKDEHLLEEDTKLYFSDYKVINSSAISTTKKICELTEDGDQDSSGTVTIGDIYNCNVGDGEERIFYVLENNAESNEISLIMNQNLEGTVQWISKEDYIKAGGTEAEYGDKGNHSKGPITLINALRSKTSSWKDVEVTIPNGQQIATAGEDTDWRVNNYTAKILSEWLVQNLDDDESTSTPYGYWTNTISNVETLNSHSWFVSNTKMLSNAKLSSDKLSIRPVIVINESQLY